jgi:4-phospho-D-threonate 3-dehydrogenase / 4-phospho-D-erythronate 3-dehydrogenase
VPLPKIAITTGDPAGIGPEIALKAVREPAILAVCRPILIGDHGVLSRIGSLLGLQIPEATVHPEVDDFDAGAIEPGKVQATCGAAALACIEEAVRGCRKGDYAAMVTCPINKSALHAAGVQYPGHTELLAARCGVDGREAMMLYSERIAVALVTCHQSLASVAAALEPNRIVAVGRLLADALRRLRGRSPRLAVCGFNPHAGEGGLFGNEDEGIIVAVGELLQLGIDVDGPLPPDSAFTARNREKYDGYVCMYHDQGLIPFKALAFEEGVNVTLGLPIVRTSVDHGTAFDIAWQGKAEHRSLVEAITLAARLV